MPLPDLSHCCFLLTLCAGLVLHTGSARAFDESPALAAEVAAGRLPPLAQRLPVDPEIVTPLQRPGRYGGTLRSALLASGDENGVLRFVAQGLTRWDTHFDHVVPNIAAHWTRNADATEYVFTLRQGLRWSDGEAFTADDVVFAVNEVLGDSRLFGSVPDRYQAGGERMHAERIDDHTVRIRFAAGKRNLPAELAGPYGHHPVLYPRHYCARFHIDHNPAADTQARAAGLPGWTALFHRQCGDYTTRWSNPEKPTLDPWVVVTPYAGDANSMHLARNPYFWQVDTAGHQLPYLDAIAFALLPDADAVLAAAREGRLDIQIRHVGSIAARQALTPRVASGEAVFMRLPDVNASAVGLYLNHTTPVPPLRALFAQHDFKAALSLAIDRPAIAHAVFKDEVTPWQVGPPVGHRFHNAQLATQYTAFDPAAANRLLDGLGLTRRDAEGYRLVNDERISPRAIVNDYSAAMIATLGMIRESWRRIGVDLRIEAGERTLVASRARANNYDIGVDVVSGGLDPTQNPRAYLAQHPADSRQSLPWVRWYDSHGAQGIEPPPAMRRRLALWDQWKAARSEEEADVLFRQILAIAADELEVLGTVSAPAQTGIRSARLANVMDDMPGAWIWPTPNPSLPQQYFFAD